MTAEKAEALERSGLWRCTARCWLDVMDSNTGDVEWERIGQHWERCWAVAMKIRAFVNFSFLFFFIKILAHEKK